MDSEIKDKMAKLHPFAPPTGDGKGKGGRAVMYRQRLFMKEKKRLSAKFGRSWAKGVRTQASLEARTRLQRGTYKLRSELATFLKKHLNLRRPAVDAMIAKRMKDMNVVRGTPEGTLLDLKYREQAQHMRVTPGLIRKANNILAASIESKFLPCETEALMPTIEARARQAQQKRIERLARSEVKKRVRQDAKNRKAKEVANKQAKRATKAADNSLSRSSPSKAAQVLKRQEKIAQIVSSQKQPNLRQIASGMNAALRAMKTAALNMKQKNSQGKTAPALAASAQAKFEKLQGLATVSLKKSPADEVRALNAQIVSISGVRSDKENVERMAQAVGPKK